MKLAKALPLLALGFVLSGCLAPRDTGNQWIVMVDVTPSVELAAEAPGDTPTDGPPAPGKNVDEELTAARNLGGNDYKLSYFEIAGTMEPPRALDLHGLPKDASQVKAQDQQISDYVRCLKGAIDLYGSGKGKVRLTIFGDFRHVSGHDNYKNWTPTPEAFGARRMDGWEVELIYPNYPSGSGSGVEERANQWAACFQKMGASVMAPSTSSRLR